LNGELLRNDVLKQNACFVEILSNGHIAKVYGLNERGFTEFYSLKMIAESMEKVYNYVKNIWGFSK